MRKLCSCLKITGFIINILFLTLLIGFVDVHAEEKVSVLKIDYEKSIISVKLGTNDTALQISDGKMKKWETVINEPVNGVINLDISWIPVGKDYTLTLRGDVNSAPVSVTIPKQNKTFKASYSPSGGLSFSDRGTGTLQWKKKNGIRWRNFPANEAEFNKTITGMIVKGGVLMFRTAPVNGDATSSGARPSKEVSVTIKPKSAAPVIRVDDVKMTLPLKKGMEYRYCDEKGNVSNGAVWTTVDKDEDVRLSTIAAKAMTDGTNKGEDVYIQFRMKATDKTQLSNIATVAIPGQEPLTQAEKEEIKLEYTSTEGFLLTVGAATEKTPYEYCILSDKDRDDGITIENYKEVSWFTVPVTKIVSVTKSKAGDGSKVYVRKKAVGKSGDEKYAIASNYYELPEIKYPKEISTIDGHLVWLQTIAGQCRETNAGNHLVFSTYSSVETPITEIKYVDYSTKATIASVLTGSGKFESVVRELTPVEISGLPKEQQDYKYLITTTIKTTEGLDSNITDEDSRKILLYFKQGANSTEYVTSDDEKGVALYIHPKSIINNPDDSTAADAMNAKKTIKITGDHGEFLTQFTRMYNSNALFEIKSNDWSKCDPHVFSVVIDLGSKYEPKSDSEGEFTNNEITVTKLVFDGVSFIKDEKNSSGDVYYIQNYVDSSDSVTHEEKRTIILTIDTNAMEKNAQIKPTEGKLPLYIHLSNGEIISNVRLEYVKSAYVVKDDNSTEPQNLSWSITGIQKKEITTTTEVNGVLTTVTTEDDSAKTIWLKLYNAQADMELSMVTFDGHSVCKDISREGGYIKAVLSNSLLNNITQNINTQISQNLVFTFDNGFILAEGFKLVINPEPSPAP